MEPRACNRWHPVANPKMVRGGRFESVRGLCKGPAKLRFSFRLDLHDCQCAVGMEPLWSLQSKRHSSAARFARVATNEEDSALGSLVPMP